ncbi:unnamed protein product [Lactuca saligna]|uniref:Uncharacterized protein n=1 Tax=Lactuca saligna TaxID=75948 RepID=A0AA36E2F8_LACSI|nr:unnamed protein product [Lactuca saligna]
MSLNSVDRGLIMNEFDPELDFAQFLEEAKTNALEEGRKDSKEKTKAKRSWKASIFSWMKANKKEEQQQLTIKTEYRNPTRRQGYVSGPINGVKSCKTQRLKRQSSGPLSGLFYQRTKMEEFEMPYTSLGKLNKSPENLSNYGPVYLVT